MNRVTGATLLLFILLTSCGGQKPVYAHDWYPPNCCSGYDCRQISETIVVPRSDGFHILESKEVIPYSDSRIKQVPKGVAPSYHRCSKGGTPEGETICLYVPVWGS